MALRSGKLGTAAYYLIRQRPARDRKVFAIKRGVKGADGKVKAWEVVEDGRLDVINKAYLGGDLTIEGADKAVMDLLQRMYAERDADKPIATFLNDNLALFDAYWATEYKGKQLKDAYTARKEFRRMLRALGNLPITTASDDDLAAALYAESRPRVYVDPDDRIAVRRAEVTSKRAYSKMVGRLNQLLIGVGRDLRLDRGKVPRPVVNHISLAEYLQLESHLPPTTQLLTRVLFGTGMRHGEAHAYDDEDVQSQGARIWVEEQLKFRTVTEAAAKGLPRFYRAPLKVDKPHHTFVLPFARDAVVAWLDVKRSERERLRVAKLAEDIEAVARKLWPDKPVKHVGLHDLRHCYAIHMLGLGINLTSVARFLGDNQQTVEWYYAGWELSDEALDRIEKLAQAGEKK